MAGEKIPDRRRKIWWVALGVLVSASLLIFAGVAARKRSRYDYLYSLGPNVAEFKAKGGGGIVHGAPMSSPPFFYSVKISPLETLVAVVSKPPSGSRSATALAFGSSDVQRVKALLTSRSRGSTPKPYGMAPNTYTFYSDGQESVGFATGTIAESLATQAGLKLDPGGCVVTLLEPPDFLSANISAVLRFLHL